MDESRYMGFMDKFEIHKKKALEGIDQRCNDSPNWKVILDKKNWGGKMYGLRSKLIHQMEETVDMIRTPRARDHYAKGILSITIPKVALLLWRLRWQRLPMLDRLVRRGTAVDNPKCVLCNKYDETIEHIFYCCDYSKGLLWQTIKAASSLTNNKSIIKRLNKIKHYVTLWIYHSLG